jgi:Tim17/Tim22/Tim23/Pmp24 family
MNPSTNSLPGRVPIWAAGKEPLPPGWTEEDRPNWDKQKQWERYGAMAMESCAVKTVLAGGAGTSLVLDYQSLPAHRTTIQGFGIGAFFSLMSASFAYEDPYLRSQTHAVVTNTQKASAIFKEMGKGMWTSGRGFAKVGALYAGIECCVESVSVVILLSLPIADLTSEYSTVLKTISTTLSEQDFWLEVSWLEIQDQKVPLAVAWPLPPSQPQLTCLFDENRQSKSSCSYSVLSLLTHPYQRRVDSHHKMPMH